MKRSILVVLMAVLVTTPCFAQEVETDGLFSIEGTRWVHCGISFMTLPPFIWPPPGCGSVGFYQDTVYSCSLNGEDCHKPRNSTDSYIDSPVISIWHDIEFNNIADWYVKMAIMQPIGLGIVSITQFYRGGFSFGIGVMFKVDNNWIPPRVEPEPEVE